MCVVFRPLPPSGLVVQNHLTNQKDPNEPKGPQGRPSNTQPAKKEPPLNKYSTNKPKPKPRVCACGVSPLPPSGLVVLVLRGKRLHDHINYYYITTILLLYYYYVTAIFITTTTSTTNIYCLDLLLLLLSLLCYDPPVS